MHHRFLSRSAHILVSLSLITTGITPTFSAFVYPPTPVGEYPGGEFKRFIDNISIGCPTGFVVRGATGTGILSCVPVSTGTNFWQATTPAGTIQNTNTGSVQISAIGTSRINFTELVGYAVDPVVAPNGFAVTESGALSAPRADFDQLCINGDCKTVWPAGGGTGSYQWTVSGTSIYYATGNVGIGGTGAPSQRLDVRGGDAIIRSDAFAVSGDDARLFLGSTNYRVRSVFGRGISLTPNGGVDVLNVNDTGNVGIGTTTPAYKLDVTGTGRVTALCIGTDCRNAWPSGGGSGITVETDPKVGSLTTNYTPKWNGTTLANSQLFDNGTNVGIGTTTPAYKLQVAGDISGTRLCIGTDCRNAWPTGGAGSGTSASGAQGAIQFSQGGLLSGNATQLFWDATNSRLGLGTSAPTDKLTIVGGNVNVGGNINADYLGSRGALYSAGAATLAATSGNVGIGTTTPAYKLDVTGTGRVTALCIGTDCRSAWPSGGGSGSATPPAGTNGAIQFNAAGAFAGNAAQLFWNATSNRLGVGTATPVEPLDVNGNIALRGQRFIVGNGTNVGLGFGTFTNNTSGTNNSALGDGVLRLNTTGYSNVAVGQSALTNNTAGYTNTAIGQVAMTSNTTGNGNAALGQAALENNTIGSFNTAVGQIAMADNTTGNGNTAVGQTALRSNTTGSGNTAIGHLAGYSTTAIPLVGSGNTFLGLKTTYTNGSITNATAVGAGVSLTTSNTLILGNNANVGIGTTTPAYKLQVAGDISGTRLCIGTDCRNTWPTGGAGSGTSASGAQGAIQFSQGGLLSGNATQLFWDATNSRLGLGTSAPTDKLTIVGGNVNVGGNINADYLGSRGALYSAGAATLAATSGNVGIGTTTPAYKLDVTGTGRVTALCIGTDCRSAWPTGGGSGITVETDPKVGSLTTNYTPKWNGTTLANSQLFDNGANVGIGTTTPSNKLTVQGAGAGNIDLVVNGRIRTGDAGGQGGVWLNSAQNSFVGDNGATFGFFTTSVGWNAFQINKATGNVGIGNATPAYKLDVTGTGAFDGICIGTDCRNAWPTGGGAETDPQVGVVATNALSKWDGAALVTSAVNEVGGNVGIGAAGATHRLTVAGNIRAGVSQTAYFGDSFTPGAGFRHMVLGTSYYDGTNFITPAVGSNAVSNIAVDTNGVAFYTTASTANAQRTDSPATFQSYERLRINNIGNVGIGAPASQRLSVGGQGIFTSSTAVDDPGDGSGPAIRIGYNTTGDYGYILANQTGVAGKNLILQRNGAAGNIGIGTTTPAFKLDVAGTTRIAGSLSVQDTTGVIGASAGSLGRLEVRSASTTDAAFMQFHRPGAYAGYFGIDTDNKWKVGGWSMGAVSYEIWHAGTFNPASKANLAGGNTFTGNQTINGVTNAAGGLVLPLTAPATPVPGQMWLQ